MSHPESCTDPDCTLSYRDHLLGIRISMAAQTTRVPDETLSNLVREKRWERDMGAYKRLRADGVQPPQIDGSALREKQGEDKFDIESRPVTIDYADAS